MYNKIKLWNMKMKSKPLSDPTAMINITTHKFKTVNTLLILEDCLSPKAKEPLNKMIILKFL